MSLKLKYIAPLLGAGVAAATIAMAPIAAAAPSPDAGAASGSSSSSNSAQQPSCTSLGGTSNVCQSPGNAQFYDAPPQVDYYPYAGGAT
jgi:hypothetical protein